MRGTAVVERGLARSSSQRSIKRRHLARALEALEPRALFSTVVLNSLADSGPGTLRDALTLAADGDTIDASALSGTIALTGGQLGVNADVSIVGPGAGALAIDGGGIDRIATIATGKTVSISGVTFTHGG